MARQYEADNKSAGASETQVIAMTSRAVSRPCCALERPPAAAAWSPIGARPPPPGAKIAGREFRYTPSQICEYFSLICITLWLRYLIAAMRFVRHWTAHGWWGG